MWYKSQFRSKKLLSAILDIQLIFGLALLKIIIPATSNLSSFVQSINIDVRKVRQNAELTITTLESCRSDESFDAVWQLAEQRSEKVKDIIDEEDISIGFKETPPSEEAFKKETSFNWRISRRKSSF